MPYYKWSLLLREKCFKVSSEYSTTNANYDLSKINMQHLVSFTSPKVNFKWNRETNDSFNNTKEMLAHDAFLVCPDFDKPFRLGADASKNQLGGIIYQDHGTIAYHYRR